MNMYGAKAKVYLSYEGSIEELSKLLCQEGEFPPFYFDTEEDKPHDKFGMTEVLGFELWLRKVTNLEKNNYEISFETTNCLDELLNDRMYDLSLWFAKYIKEVCEIETTLG